jgi:hypothetical protein
MRVCLLVICNRVIGYFVSKPLPCKFRKQKNYMKLNYYIHRQPTHREDMRKRCQFHLCFNTFSTIWSIGASEGEISRVLHDACNENHFHITAFPPTLSKKKKKFMRSMCYWSIRAQGCSDCTFCSLNCSIIVGHSTKRPAPGHTPLFPGVINHSTVVQHYTWYVHS